MASVTAIDMDLSISSNTLESMFSLCKLLKAAKENISACERILIISLDWLSKLCSDDTLTG